MRDVSSSGTLSRACWCRQRCHSPGLKCRLHAVVKLLWFMELAKGPSMLTAWVRGWLSHNCLTEVGSTARVYRFDQCRCIRLRDIAVSGHLRTPRPFLELRTPSRLHNLQTARPCCRNPNSHSAFLFIPRTNLTFHPSHLPLPQSNSCAICVPVWNYIQRDLQPGSQQHDQQQQQHGNTVADSMAVVAQPQQHHAATPTLEPPTARHPNAPHRSDSAPPPASTTRSADNSTLSPHYAQQHQHHHQQPTAPKRCSSTGAGLGSSGLPVADDSAKHRASGGRTAMLLTPDSAAVATASGSSQGMLVASGGTLEPPVMQQQQQHHPQQAMQLGHSGTGSHFFALQLPAGQPAFSPQVSSAGGGAGGPIPIHAPAGHPGTSFVDGSAQGFASAAGAGLQGGGFALGGAQRGSVAAGGDGKVIITATPPQPIHVGGPPGQATAASGAFGPGGSGQGQHQMAGYTFASPGLHPGPGGAQPGTLQWVTLSGPGPGPGGSGGGGGGGRAAGGPVLSSSWPGITLAAGGPVPVYNITASGVRPAGGSPTTMPGGTFVTTGPGGTVAGGGPVMVWPSNGVAAHGGSMQGPGMYGTVAQAGGRAGQGGPIGGGPQLGAGLVHQQQHAALVHAGGGGLINTGPGGAVTLVGGGAGAPGQAELGGGNGLWSYIVPSQR